jgi:predicted nuclease with TOPRIM domain
VPKKIETPKKIEDELEEIKRLELEASLLEEKAKKLRDKVSELKNKPTYLKCEWHSCTNVFVAEPTRKKRFCSDACRMNKNSVTYREKQREAKKREDRLAKKREAERLRRQRLKETKKQD